MKKGENNILTQSKHLVLIFGILIGFFSMTLNSQWTISTPHSIENSTGEEDAEAGQIVKSIDAITYSSQINVTQQSVLIEELPEDEDEEIVEIEDNFVISNTSKALKILFRRIIAPNAP